MANRDLARVLSFLELTVTRRLDGLLRGAFPSAAPGPGSDPDAAREYVIGDDVRRMDWAVTARTGIAHVRDPEAERELECWIIAEPSPRLTTGFAATTKKHLLTAAVGAISLLNNGPGSRTGLVAGDLLIPRGAGRSHSMQLMHQVSEHASSSNIAADIQATLAGAPRLGLLVVVSDFLGPIDWADALRVASTRAEVLVIRLVDTADEELPGEGPVLFADAETGKTVSVNINAGTREKYRAHAASHTAAVTEAFRGAQARIITLRTDEDWVVEFARQLGARQ